MYHKGNYPALREQLKIDWASLMKDKTAQECWVIFKDKITSAEAQHIPTSKGKGRRRQPAWLTGTVRKIIRRKEKVLKIYLNSRDGQEYLKYQQARNQLKREVKKARRN